MIAATRRAYSSTQASVPTRTTRPDGSVMFQPSLPPMTITTISGWYFRTPLAAAFCQL